MATISTAIKGKGESATIYIRLSIDRKNVFMRKSGFVIDSSNWSKKKSEPIQKNADLKILKTELDKLKNYIQSALNTANASQEYINSQWLQEQIDIFRGKGDKKGSSLTSWFDKYLEHLKATKGINGISKTSQNRYTNTKNKVSKFEVLSKREFAVVNVNTEFSEKFTKYLLEKEKLTINTASRLLIAVKTVCNFAKRKGVIVSPELDAIKSVKKDVLKVTLSFDEINIIKDVELPNNYLDNARNWLVLGCHIGQRVSDLLTLTSSSISIKNNTKFIFLKQQKTGKDVLVPINKTVQEILDRNNGDFPHKISDTNFNKYIKTVCEIAGINEVVKGSKSVAIGKDKKDNNIYRKVVGNYPKHELIASHICRRSYATNYYGIIPTALLISVTAHSTEKQFLEYVGKAPMDQAMQLAELYAQMEKKENSKEKK